MKRKLALTLGAASLTVAGVMGLAPAASAVTGNVGVKAASFTIYEKDAFGGRHASFTRSDSNLANNLWNDGITNCNDSASSMKNRTSKLVELRSNANYTGDV